MRWRLRLTWAITIILATAVTIWTGYWLYFVLFTELKEAMSIGIFPTLIGAAILVWLIMFTIPSLKNAPTRPL